MAAEAAATERMGVAQGKVGAGDPAAELMRALDALEGRIAHVAHRRARRPALAPRGRRARARARGRELIEQGAFAACDGDLANLLPLFTDDSRAARQRSAR